jgi:hypothetical protein
MDSRKFIGGFEIRSAPSRPLLGSLKQWREGFGSASRFFLMPFFQIGDHSLSFFLHA